LCSVLPIHGSPSPANARSQKPGQKFTAGVSDASEKLKDWEKEQTLLGFVPQEKEILTQRRFSNRKHHLVDLVRTVHKRYNRG